MNLPPLLAMAGCLMAGTLLPLMAATPAPDPDLQTVFVGTYTGGESRGIYRAQLNIRDGQLGRPELAAEATHPSFLALHPNRRFLYAVSEGGGRDGAVLAFSIDATGALKPLNRQSSRGAGPCHLAADVTGRCLLVANYGGGSVALLPVQPDGALGEATAFRQHAGSGPNTKRQEQPHAHGAYFDPGNRFALVPDLGIDQVVVYRRTEAGDLTPADPPAARLAPGAGPRHLAFHPNGRYVYVVNELHSTVTACAYAAGSGTLTELQTVSTLPAGFTGATTTAEIAVHPNGQTLYASNRGHDSLAWFTIEANTGTLGPKGHVPTRGKTPRHFALDPSGRWLLAANQDSNSVAVFRVEPKSGELSPVGEPVTLPRPVCLLFWTPPLPPENRAEKRP